MAKLKTITFAAILLLAGATSALAHPGVTPYAYCAANPVKLVDPDGRDYKVIIDEENRTITISATYYTTKEDETSAKQAIDFWNNQSGNFIYEAVNKNNKTDIRDYEVNFDLRIELKSSGREAKDIAKKDKSGNSYKINIDTDIESKKNGETKNGKHIYIKESRKDDLTGAHEIGHTLGLVHSNYGLMTPGQTDENRKPEVLKSNIKSMIEFPLKGIVNTERDNNAGKGNVIRTGGASILNISDYKGKVKRNK